MRAIRPCIVILSLRSCSPGVDVEAASHHAAFCASAVGLLAVGKNHFSRTGTVRYFADSLFARQAPRTSLAKERMANGEERSSGEKPFLWLVAEKVPLLALSAASALLTMKAQWVNGTLGGLNSYPFSMRLSGSIIGYVRYFSHASGR